MSVDPYLIPGTQTLRNLAGITDPYELIRFEFDVTVARTVEIERGEVLVPGHFDLAHLKAVHRRIFGDVYDWAGELRSVDIAKGDSLFALARFIEPAAAALFADLANRDYLRGAHRERFVAGAAHLLSELNALHPFRDGNGRAQRSFLGLLARQAGWRIDWTLLAPGTNVAA